MSTTPPTHLELTPPNITLRPAMLDDCAAVVNLLNICSRALSGVDEFSVDSLHGEWTQPGFDLTNSSMTAIDDDNRIVGYIDVWDMQDPPVKPFTFGRVHPDFRGQGIGTALLSWAEGRSRQAIDRVPEGASVAMIAAADYNRADAVQLFTDRGFTAKRYSWEMSIDLPETPSRSPGRTGFGW
ncbi:MAG: GNAT family N-acetyltransferase [Caldilineaceae bacterium]